MIIKTEEPDRSNGMLELLKKRRSIRKYEDKAIEEDKVCKIMQAALLSPSSRGKNPWEFIVVRNKEKLIELSRSRQTGSAFIKDAAMAVVVLADETITDVWVEDASIASILIQLEAHSLGLGTCWIQIRNRMHDEKTSAVDYIKKILIIPEKFQVEAIISIGYPAEFKKQRSEDELIHDKVHYDFYGRR